jgi:hypothetical protein
MLQHEPLFSVLQSWCLMAISSWMAMDGSAIPQERSDEMQHTTFKHQVQTHVYSNS